jgi:hypothetical protein
MKADVVFQIAAAAGMGVLQAAKERDLYAIGVDTTKMISSRVMSLPAILKTLEKPLKMYLNDQRRHL